MAVDVARIDAQRSRIGGVRVAASEKLLLAGIVLVSFVVRVAAAVPHTVPRLFPDEYIYAALARSISHGNLTIRGRPAHFPALLEPLVTAPLWALGSVETSFRLIQGQHALVASLVAVPVWMIGRRLGLAPWQRLSCAVLALALPLLLYSSYLSADILGLTLAVAATAAAVDALERATVRAQAAFLLLAGLATLARVQYVVLPVAFCVGALVVARGRPLAALSRYRATAIAIAVPTALLLVVGPGRVLGYYEQILHSHVDLAAMARWSGSDLMLVAYAVGFVLVPAALVGLACGVCRPRDGIERAFTVFVAAVAGLLLFEAALYATNGSGRFQERYLGVLFPMIPLLFFLGLRRLGSRHVRLATIAIALGLLLVSARAPLSGYTVGFGSQDSPLLQAVYQLEQLTSSATGALLVALLAGALALLAVFTAVRPRIGAVASVAAAALVLTAASIASVATDVQRTHRTQALFPVDARWVDHAHVGDVSILVTPGSLRAAASSAMFWNESITRLLHMPLGDEVDNFGQTPIHVGPTGELLTAAGPVTGALLVEEYASSLTLTGAQRLRTAVGASLWRVTGTPRLSMLTYGRYFDGWLAWPSASVTIWPEASAARTGTLCLDLSAPRGVKTTVTLTAPGFRRVLPLAAGSRRALAIPVSAAKAWQLDIAGSTPASAAGRPVSLQASQPRFIPGKASAVSCR